MRPVLLCAALVFAAACAPDPIPNPPTPGRFYFPTGIAFDERPNDAGVLFVASSNFDKRFDRGALSLVSLAGLPVFAAAPALDAGAAFTEHAVVNELGEQRVDIQSFAGDVALWRVGEATRAFVASRAENAPLQFVDAALTDFSLSCGYAQPGAPQDCFSNALSLVEAEDTEAAIPRAPAPSAVFVSPFADGGEVFVGHMLNADSPFGTKQNEDSYIVRTSAEAPAITESTDPAAGGSFISIGRGGTSSVIATSRWIFATGRYVNDTAGGQLIRMVNRFDSSKRFGAGLESVFHSTEARGIAVVEGQGGKGRVFLAARDPDVLLIADATGLDRDDQPTLRIVRQVPLPDNPNDVKLIDRAGRGPLAIISCSGDDSVVIYDDDVGAVVARLPTGDQPYGIAIQRLGGGARAFVTNFADGRVAVIEIADLQSPSGARIIAHLGRSQRCIVNGRQSSTECQNEPL